MINLRFVPLELKDFPSPRPAAAKSKFKASWQSTLDLLDRELKNLGARGIVLQAGYRAEQIRQDGWPLSKAVPSHSCVILSFRDRKDRPLSFPCATFAGIASNIRAIALSLEALRAVDRFGVTKLGEQYAGFKQIEAPKQWTVDDAAAFIEAKCGVRADVVLQSQHDYRIAYRAAAKLLHPDVGGSEVNPHEWGLLADAKALLDAHHGKRRGAETS